MNIRNLAILTLFTTVFLCSSTFGQQPTQAPSPKPDTKLRAGEFTVTRSVPLEQELVRSEIEPRSKRFEMNLRFIRARYSKAAQENTIKHQYLWDYFPEAVITVQFVEYPAGFFAQMSADERKKKAAELLDVTLSKAAAVRQTEKDIKVGDLLVKQVEFTLNEKNYIARTFADRDVWYVLYAQPRTDNALPLINKLFDSFKFVKN